MKDCISHQGFYDDWDNPLTDQGEPYLPGARTCGHRDCVNPLHIEGLENQAAFILESQRQSKKRTFVSHRPAVKRLAHEARVALNKANWQSIYEKVVEIGHMPRIEGATTCQLPYCERPYRARNLCMNHWQIFRRQSPESLKRLRRYKSDDFLTVPAPIFKRKDVEWPSQCTFENCEAPVKCRSLCKNHYRQFWKRKNKDELWADRRKYTLADFAHLPTDYRYTNKKFTGKCSLEHCGEPQNVKTLCENHYRTYRRLTKAAKKENA